MRRVLGITCARGGSKGVPNKNIRDVAGKPLIAYTIDEAKRATLLSRYVVSTDSQEIADVAKSYGAEVPFLRPTPLAYDWTPTYDVLKHALGWAEKDEGEEYDAIADIRCTNPFKVALDIDGAIDKLFKTGADAVIGVSKLEDHHPSRIKRIVNDTLLDFSWPEPPGGNRQDLSPDAYIRNGSVYIVRRTAFMEGIHFDGSFNIRPWIMPPERGVNIDTEYDLLLADVMLRNP